MPGRPVRLFSYHNQQNQADSPLSALKRFIGDGKLYKSSLPLGLNDWTKAWFHIWRMGAFRRPDDSNETMYNVKVYLNNNRFPTIIDTLPWAEAVELASDFPGAEVEEVGIDHLVDAAVEREINYGV